MRHRILITTAAAAAIAVFLVPSAGAAGGPPFGMEAGAGGVTVPGALGRYVTLHVGNRTVLQRIQPSTGRIAAWRTLRGHFAVPSVAIDGTAGGLSANGSTLVLVQPQMRFPIARTHMLLVDPATLRTQPLDLRGDFSFDALSADGKTLFLVQYVSAGDPTRYAVRAFDLGTRRLVPGVIVDRREPDEQMAGTPLTRVTSPDGRWAYTLYDGNGTKPFIHALDTTRRQAFCVDLPGLRGDQSIFDSPRLTLGGPGVQVVVGGAPIAAMSTRTMRATEDLSSVPARPATRRPAAGEGDGGGGGVPWAIVLGGALAAAAGLAVALGTRRRRTALPG